MKAPDEARDKAWWLSGGGLRGLYAIVDPSQCTGRDPLAIAEAVLAGGCAALQLRAKQLSDAELHALGMQLRARCREAGVPFVLNDRADLALALNADGLHLGQHDLAIARARQQVGSMPIGLSTHDLAQAREAEARGADLIGFGPVFPTRSKADPDPVVGLAGLGAVQRAVSIPVVAIGGIDLGNVDAVAATGVPLCAVISAVCAAADPARAARRLHDAFR